MSAAARRAPVMSRGACPDAEPCHCGTHSTVVMSRHYETVHRHVSADAPASELGRAAAVDLVEVPDAVPGAPAARPLPHHGIPGPGRDAAEEPRAGPGTAQAPAGGLAGQAAGGVVVGPLVGMRDQRRAAVAEDLGPDGG